MSHCKINNNTWKKTLKNQPSDSDWSLWSQGGQRLTDIKRYVSFGLSYFLWHILCWITTCHTSGSLKEDFQGFLVVHLSHGGPFILILRQAARLFPSSMFLGLLKNNHISDIRKMYTYINCSQRSENRIITVSCSLTLLKQVSP